MTPGATVVQLRDGDVAVAISGYARIRCAMRTLNVVMIMMYDVRSYDTTTISFVRTQYDLMLYVNCHEGIYVWMHGV